MPLRQVSDLATANLLDRRYERLQASGWFGDTRLIAAPRRCGTWRL